MAWIESHQKLLTDPKLFELCASMGWNKAEAIGRLHMFWWWCVDHAETGDLRLYNDCHLALAVELNAEQGKEFVEAMVKAGFIERMPYFRIVNWWKFTGKFLQSRYSQDPKKWKKIAKNFDDKKSIRLAYANKGTPNIPNQPNLTNLTEPNILSQNSVLLDTFGESLKSKINVYIDRIRQKNKSQVITEGRKNTLLTELFNTRERFKNDGDFTYAIDEAINRDACCIGYINAIMKNRATKRPR